jgi:hypothetical protein
MILGELGVRTLWSAAGERGLAVRLQLGEAFSKGLGRGLGRAASKQASKSGGPWVGAFCHGEAPSPVLAPRPALVRVGLLWGCSPVTGASGDHLSHTRQPCDSLRIILQFVRKEFGNERWLARIVALELGKLPLKGSPWKLLLVTLH